MGIDGGDFLNIQWKHLLTCLAIPLAVGSLSSLLARNTMETFEILNKPALAPPGWLFPVVWTFLYLRISKPAGYLMLPYLLWVTFAGYLNYSIYLLN